MAKRRQRTDADRRARQCERLSRLMRVLKLILGPGRWDVEGLANELECSTRTIHRLLQTLTMAGVPWFFDNECQAYRVQAGFRFPGIDAHGSTTSSLGSAECKRLSSMVGQAIKDGERFLTSLREFSSVLDTLVKE